ncbi:MAG: GNAT family N-acetyltransferase [endosymbiont of Galathealinum brachiosum]|uniref:GNAT family N-acetyltransferase n=1 Tax=endosymbiont of Galathealinum brachiosum TaxID=2200906 RepID=A0A370DEY8_9GAMM|nr:MAG: GNAT family N-acetyltransferase [endosymbiont of Galathealinum brachiosum]
MNLLPYNPDDTDEIQQLFTRVFSDSEGETEGQVIGNLVYNLMSGTKTQDLYGFVAIENEIIIGSIFFSPLTFKSKDNAFLLSPVAIDTSHQGKGIGQKLINYGINHLKEKGVELIFTYGDPMFYSKVGFSLISEKTIKAPHALTHPEGWLGQSLVDDEIKPITGTSYCVNAFNKSEYW